MKVSSGIPVFSKGREGAAGCVCSFSSAAEVSLCFSAACSTHQSSVMPNGSPWCRPEKTTQDGKEKHLGNQKAVKWITHQYLSISTYLVLCFLFFQGTERDGQQGHIFPPCRDAGGYHGEAKLQQHFSKSLLNSGEAKKSQISTKTIEMSI